MCTFVELTDAKTNDKIWINMDQVSIFHWVPDPGYTQLSFRSPHPDMPDDIENVWENLTDIQDLIVSAKQNYGYGFGTE